jgi:flagellar M-ring protein FliF
MNQLRHLIANLTVRQRVTIGLAIAVVIASLLGISRWEKDRDFKPLYSNLSAEDAGQVVNRIHELGVEYRLAANGATILVPSEKVAELRIELAAAGLPKTGRIGFELFDRNNFGETDFTEQVNYHRALEGELERSIMALDEVEQARVHITFPKDSIYLESKQPAKGSVLVKLRLGAHLSEQNVAAICHLIASAVEGLSPGAVSVLDTEGDLLSRPRQDGSMDGSDASDALLDYRQRVEKDLLAKIDRTLDPLLGGDNYRAGVFVDCDRTSGDQSSETFDPTKSVMVSSQRTDDSTASPVASGVPGTASNLPRPVSRPAGGTTGVSRRSENIAYESSRVVRHVKIPQGEIKRISVSVLLDQNVRFVKGKRIIDPPSAQKLQVVKDLVAGVAGIVPARGDQVIVETFPFEATLNAAPLSAAPAPPRTPLPAWMPAWLAPLMAQKSFPILAGIALGAVLLLAIGVVVVFMKMRRKKRTIEVAKGLPPGREPKALPAGPDVQRELEDKLAEQAVIKERQAQEVLQSLKLPPVTTKKTEVLIKHIGAEAKKDGEALAHVVRTWLNATES